MIWKQKNSYTIIVRLNSQKNEKNFLHLLICNQGKCVNYTLIEDVVYDGEFKSLDAIRSLIKRLRKKLPKDIIFNNLDEGYFIK